MDVVRVTKGWATATIIKTFNSHTNTRKRKKYNTKRMISFGFVNTDIMREITILMGWVLNTRFKWKKEKKENPFVGKMNSVNSNVSLFSLLQTASWLILIREVNILLIKLGRWKFVRNLKCILYANISMKTRIKNFKAIFVETGDIFSLKTK